MSNLHQQKQRRDFDCALACIASFVERPYDDIWPADFLASVDKAKGAYGEELTRAFEFSGLVKGEHYKLIYLPDSWIAAPQIKTLLFGRRAFMQVPSLNNENGQHMVYWNGHELFDPSNKQQYKFLSHCQPSHLWLFDERAPLPAAPAPTEQAVSEVMPSPMYFKALALAHESGRASVAQTQRVLSIGWAEAENLIDLMIQRGDVEYAMTGGLRPARPAPQESKAEQAALSSDFLMPEDAWNEYATRSGLLNEHGVAPHPATAQAAYFAYQAAWNCLHKAFSDYIAARQAPKEPLSEAQLDHIARSYFAEPHAQENAKNAIHDAFLGARQAPDSRDAARLDWLIKEECMVENLALGDTRYRIRWPNLEEAQTDWFKNARDAIDAAGAQEKAQ